MVVCSYGNGASAVGDRLCRRARKAGAVETAAATLFGSPRIEEVVADLTLENRVLKKRVIADGDDDI